jgi:hypothetical protein
MDGENRITVTAADSSGNRSSDEIVITYDPLGQGDVIAPVVTITSPTMSPEFTTGSGTIDLVGTAADNISVTRVTWSSDSGAGGTANGTSSWSIDSIALEEGENRITVTAADSSGNRSSDEIVITYDVLGEDDVVAPVVTIMSPTTRPDFSTDSSTIDLAGTAADNVSVTRVTWSSDTGAGGAADGTSNWSIDSIALREGENRITVTAEDSSGNRSNDQIVITYDSPGQDDVIAPVVTITSPTTRPEFTSDTNTIDLAGTAADNVLVTRVTWTSDRGASGAADGTSSWSIDALPLQSGANRISVTATDAAGNASADEITVLYTPETDDVAPTISITSPSDTGSFTTGDDSITVSGSASDDTAVTSVTWRLDGGDSANAIGLEEWTTPVILLDAGDNTIEVEATDAAGNSSSAQIVVTLEVATPDVLRGIAVIGDSNADEFRANDNRGGAYAATTLNWVEQLVRYRGLNFGTWGNRGSPRRTGYQFNWALSGATAASMISGGQHTGVAQQIAAGDVSLVFIDIGFNDFAREKYAEIYSGSLSGSALNRKIEGIIDDITEAVETVQAAGSVEVVVAGLIDYSVSLPNFTAAFPDAARRQAVTDSIRAVNDGLITMAASKGAAYVDQPANTAAIFAQANANWFLDVGGELIDMMNPGNEPHHARLNDASQHAGTVFNAIYFANMNFIDVVNSAFDTSLVPFSESEILRAAGIDP